MEKNCDFVNIALMILFFQITIFFHRNYFQITSTQLKAAASQHKSEKTKIKEVSQIEPVMAFIAILIYVLYSQIYRVFSNFQFKDSFNLSKIIGRSYLHESCSSPFVIYMISRSNQGLKIPWKWNNLALEVLIAFHLSHANQQYESNFMVPIYARYIEDWSSSFFLF